jgi:hypothetical protein
MTVKGKMVINGANGRHDNKDKSRIQIGCIVNVIVHGYRCTNLFLHVCIWQVAAESDIQ